MDFLLGAKLLSSSGIQKMSDIGYAPFFYVMLTALVASLFLTFLYLKFYGSKGIGSTVYRSFPILGVAITAIFVTLQFSIPLSLGLLGALSIVRFRTPIKDPEEIGFILLVIANAICCATFNLYFLLIMMIVSVLGLVILNWDKKYFRKNSAEGSILIHLPLSAYQNHAEKILKRLDQENGKISSIAENNTEAAITYSFKSMETPAFVKLSQDVKSIHSEAKINMYFNSPGEI
jgi:hypothetical protein